MRIIDIPCVLAASLSFAACTNVTAATEAVPVAYSESSLSDPCIDYPELIFRPCSPSEQSEGQQVCEEKMRFGYSEPTLVDCQVECDSGVLDPTCRYKTDATALPVLSLWHDVFNPKPMNPPVGAPDGGENQVWGIDCTTYPWAAATHVSHRFWGTWSQAAWWSYYNCDQVLSIYGTSDSPPPGNPPGNMDITQGTSPNGSGANGGPGLGTNDGTNRTWYYDQGITGGAPSGGWPSATNDSKPWVWACNNDPGTFPTGYSSMSILEGNAYGTLEDCLTISMQYCSGNFGICTSL